MDISRSKSFQRKDLLETSFGNLLFGIGGLLAGIGAFIAFIRFAKLADRIIEEKENESEE